MSKVCVRCGQEIPEGEDTSGPLLHTEDGIVCGRCMPQYFASLGEARAETQAEAPQEVASAKSEAGPAEAAPDDSDPARTLAEIRRELSRVRQAMMFERPSLWNILGGVTQCFAFAALVVAAFRWAGNPQPALLLAILLQTMALTFFFNGR